MITWQTLSHPPLEFEEYIPSKFSGPRLPGFKAISSEGSFGRLCVQTYNSAGYCMQYTVVENSEQLQLKAKTGLEGLFARIMLENHVAHNIRGAGELIIHEGQFSMMTGIAPEAMLHFGNRRYYSSFDAFFSMPMLYRVLSRFPALQRFFSHELSRLPHILVDPKPPEGDTRVLLDRVLENPGNDEYAEQLLQSFVSQIEERRKLKRPAPDVLEKIYAAERIVAEDIRHHYLIPILAKKVQTNQCTLKSYFPFEFGTGPYKYHLRKKMRLARKLILEKMPIKNVARETGYKSTAEFSKAFKAFHKISPSELLSHPQ